MLRYNMLRYLCKKSQKILFLKVYSYQGPLLLAAYAGTKRGVFTFRSMKGKEQPCYGCKYNHEGYAGGR